MSQSNPDKPPQDEDSLTKAHRRFEQHVNSMVGSLWGLPSAIYNRGNEHGREFNSRLYRGRKEHEEEQESEERRAPRDCAWRGRQQCRRDEVRDGEDAAQKDVDDWVNKVVRELERGEEQAKEMYEWWRKMEEDEQKEIAKTLRPDEGVVVKCERVEEEKKASTWSDIFPKWSSRALDSKDAKVHEHVFGREGKDRPLTAAARDVEDTIDKLHADFERWLGGAEQWRQRVRRGYQRDSRLWEEEGLFGSSVPFSRPLSTMFSLGMRPFMPQDSAIAYILYSEYSPLHLERDDGFDSTWRQRFEDLLKVQEGKRMSSTTDLEQYKQSSSVDWLSRIIPLLKEGENGQKGQITIGSTPNQHAVVQVEEVHTPLEPSERPRQPEQHQQQSEPAYEGPETETDLYERHFRNLPRVSAENPAPAREVERGDDTQSSKLSILSTMTATERHVAPDGSITTKTVLKKRFADGREESSETVETTPAARVSQPQHQKQDKCSDRPNTESRIVKEAKGSKGWFWSS